MNSGKKESQFIRLELLLGEEPVRSLHDMRVAVFGVGGVGGYVCEALVRSGIGAFDLIDNDVVSESNLNRQIIATHSTIGKYKVDVMKDRMLDINPEVRVRTHKKFILPDTVDEIPFEEFDYVVDAIDTVSGKIAIIMKAKELEIPVISSMGTGNKLNPGKLLVTDIHKTQTCPLARVMRHEMKKRGVKKLKVVYSEEPAMKPLAPAEEPVIRDGEAVGVKESCGKSTPGSTAFVPGAAGLMIASEVIRDLTEK